MAATDQPNSVAGLLAAAGTWTLDPSATSIKLHTKAMWGLAKVKADFKATSGSATVAADGTVNGTLVIDAASVDSGNNKRDTHLRTADFFDVEQHPTFTYAVTSARTAGGNDVVLSGTLTAHGVTRPLEVPATISDASATAATITAEVEIDRSDWGVSWAKLGAKLDNRILIAARFTK